MSAATAQLCPLVSSRGACVLQVHAGSCAAKTQVSGPSVPLAAHAGYRRVREGEAVNKFPLQMFLPLQPHSHPVMMCNIIILKFWMLDLSV